MRLNDGDIIYSYYIPPIILYYQSFFPNEYFMPHSEEQKLSQTEIRYKKCF